MVDTSAFEWWQTVAAEGTVDQRFNAFVLRHNRFLFRVAFAILRNHADAEDAAQETFLKLYRLGGWESANNEKGFLAKAAWRIAVTRVRHKLDTPPENVASGDRHPEQAAIRANQEDWVHRLIDALPEDSRVPLALSSVEGLTSTEIGLMLAIPEGTIRTRIARAKRILRGKIEERYGSR